MSVGKEASRILSITVTSGTGTGTITKDWAVCRWVRVVPIAETDSYDVTLKDSSGYIIMKRTGQIGTLSENLEISLGILGSVLIESATQDGEYKFLADMH
jgi:hypothetical protein